MTKQVRNQYSSAGITQREADTIQRCMDKLSNISEKNNLYVRYRLRIKKALEELEQLLVEADRS